MDPEGNSIAMQLLILLFFTLINAIFAGTEMAVVSVNKTRIRTLAEEGNKKAVIIQGLFEDSTRFLSAIQVAITFAGFYSSASAASGIAPMLGEWMEGAGIPYAQTIAHNGVTLVLMFFNLVFGELVPKRIALQKAEAFCMLTVMPIHYISKILSPFIKLLSFSTKLVLKILGLKTEDEEEVISREEIRAMMKAGHESGIFDDNQKEMLDSVFSFDEKTAKEVMRPRQKVVTLDINDVSEEKIDELLECKHSRIPVYDDSIDNILGILHMKDVMIAARKGNLDQSAVRSMVRDAYFVPEHKDAAQLFREMQAAKIHLSILIDEYGGFSGIVTIEDLVEEIVGEIDEEHESTEKDISYLGNGQYRILGSADIDDVNDKFGLKMESKICDTLSGYIIETLGYIPTEELMGSININGCTFTIEEIEGTTIKTLIMNKND